MGIKAKMGTRFSFFGGKGGTAIQVLLIEHGSEKAKLLRGMLLQEQYPFFKVACAKNLQAGLGRLSKDGIDVILLDLDLPDSKGQGTLEKVFAHAAEVPVIILTDRADEKLALEVLGKGAQECLVKKELNPKMLSRVIQYAIERTRVEQRVMAEKAQAERLAGELDSVLKKLKTTQDEMLRREKAMVTGELAAAVAHEIRNPLSIISMSVQYLQSKFEPNDPRREFTEAIVRKVQRLDAVTKRLISYGRERELRLVRRNLNRELDRALALIKIQCRSQGIEIVRRYDRKLPTVMLDEEILDEVFTNLLTNALEVMRHGGTLTLVTHYDLERKEVVVKICDNGKGIDSKHRSQLFKPFFSTKKEVGGTGLGLTITQRAVSQHGGTVTLESHRSGSRRGTTFTICLPIMGPHVLVQLSNSHPELHT